MKTLNNDTMPLDSRVKYKHDRSGLETGRSMVEMLGVLAVIGVLSIGGIMGYSYGMDKYRANETTNQIMLRAIDLMTQASNNNAELSLDAWKNEQTQYTFGEVGSTYDGLVYLDVAGLPKRICEIVYDNMSSMAVQIDINAVRSLSNETCGDDNEMTFYFEGGISGTCDPACPEGQYCDNGICFKGGVPEASSPYLDKECTSDADCNTDWNGPCIMCDWTVHRCLDALEANGNECIIKEGNIPGQCSSGTCVPKGDGCTTNNDCTEPGTYCASTNSSHLERFQDGETGSCVPLDFIRKEISGETYYISNRLMSWWDAEFACDAIGRNIEMISVDDLVTESDGSKWKKDRGIHTHTKLAKSLYTPSLGNVAIWTRERTEDNLYGFAVDLSDGYVDHYLGRFYFKMGLALCK